MIFFRYQKALAISTLLVGVLAIGSVAAAMAAEEPGRERGERDVLRQRHVQWSASRLPALHRPGVQLLTVDLFPDTSILIRLEPAEGRGGRLSSWTGQVLSDPASSVVLSRLGDRVVADVWTGGEAYRIRPAQSGLHRIQQLGPAALPEELPPVPAPAANGPPHTIAAARSGATEAPVFVDVVVGFTRAAQRGAGGKPELEAQVQNMLAWTNEGLANNGFRDRVRLVGLVGLGLQDAPKTTLDSLTALRRGEGPLGQLHELRSERGADAVFLIQEAGDSCGRSYLMQSPDSGFASYAFALVIRECTTSFAHELGHLLGAHHELEAGGGTGVFGFSHGRVEPETGWRTAMATNAACTSLGKNCTRLPYWSDPGLEYAGARLGISDESDNAATLDRTLSLVASFRRAVSDLAPPRRLRAVRRGAPEQTRIVVRWRRSSGASRHSVLRSVDGRDYVPVDSLSGNRSRYVDRGVRPELSRYCYQIVARNGDTEASAGPVCVGTTASSS